MTASVVQSNSPAKVEASQAAGAAAGEDEDLRRACRELDGGRRSVWILLSAFLYCIMVGSAYAGLTIPISVVLVVSVMSGLLLLNTIFALISVRSMRRSVRWLDRDLDLPGRLHVLREDVEQGADPRAQVLNALAEGIGATRKRPPDTRVVDAAHRLRALAMAVSRQPYTARVHLSMPKATVDDDYRCRSWLHLMSQVLLYSGIIATLYGLFISFNDTNLSNLVQTMLARREIDSVSFSKVVIGFTVAFGSSAFGYMAFLFSRFQQEIADGYSAGVALLIENDLSEAVTRAFAKLAIEVPIMPPGMEEALNKLQATMSSATAKQLGDFAKVAESVTQATEALQDTLEKAGQAADGFANLLTVGRTEWKTAADVWAGSSSQFALKADEAARAMERASASISGAAAAVAASAGLMVEAAKKMTVELDQGAKTINSTIEDGLKRILEQTDTQVTKFNEALVAFRQHIEKQVEDFKDAHDDVTRGRQQLHAVLSLGHQQVMDVAGQLGEAINQLVAAEELLGKRLQGLGGELRSELVTMRDSLRAVEAGLQGRGRTVHDKLDDIIGLTSGARVFDGQGAGPRRDR